MPHHAIFINDLGHVTVLVMTNHLIFKLFHREILFLLLGLMDDAIDLDDSINLEETRSQRLQEFNLIAKALLSRDDRSVLYKVLKDYRLRHDVNRLVHGLRIVFQTNRKIELLKYVRYFLDEPHILEFDRMTNFHSKFRPRRQRRRKRSRLHDGKFLTLIMNLQGIKY